MIRFACFWLLAFSAFSAFCQEGEVRKVGSFTGVSASEGLDVYLRQGESESVRVVASGGTDPKQIVTEVVGKYLKIHVLDGYRMKNVYAKIFVTYRTLDKISASSASHVYSDGAVKARSLEVGCSSAAAVELELEVDDLEVDVSSAGDVELKGTAVSATMEVSSAGQLDSYDLEVRELQVEVSSGGAAKVNVTEALVAQASSGGNIRYRGNPAKSKTDSSSGGSVKKSY